MSNDKTLATAKHGGCVQLATAPERCAECRHTTFELHPDGHICVHCKLIVATQPSPGGEGDAPLRVFSAGRWTYDGTGQTFSHEDMDAAAFVVYRDAALSAQPSPGGQGELLGYVRVEAIKALREDDEVTGVMVHVEERTDSVPVYLAASQSVRIYGCCAQLEGELHTAECPNMRHLAARQPVGEIVAWQHCGENHEHMVISDSRKKALKEGETEKGIRKIDAAYSIPLVRQPVGEPFGYCADFDPGAHEFSHTFYYLAPGETVPAGCTAFYTTPPAQAVDMGPVRVLADHAAGRINHANNGLCPDEVEGHDTRDPDCPVCCALLDSQAVGK